jgi:Bacterial Ig-like domain (group 3)
VIREVVKATSDIITVAGDGKAGYTGDSGPATKAELNAPNTVAVDPAGDVFFADANNDAVREVVKSSGDIITVAGDGKAGYTGDNGPATKAELNGGTGVALDSLGDVFITDDNNNRIREVVKATGDIITIAGDGIAGNTGDNGPATAAELSPWRVAINAEGELFAADDGNNVVREITPPVTVTITSPPAPTPLPTPSPSPSPTPTPRLLSTSSSSVFEVSTSGLPGNGSLTPIPAVSPRFLTRTTLAVRPRSPRPGEPATLIATVKPAAGPRDVRAGSVTFLDGTIELGTAPLSHGQATLVTAGLVPGRNRIQARYSSGPGMAPSTTTLIITVRPTGRGSQVIASPQISHSAPRILSTAPLARGGMAKPTGAVTLPGGPTFLGTVVVDQGAIGPGSEPKRLSRKALIAPEWGARA